MVESQPSKLLVASSILVSRSMFSRAKAAQRGFKFSTGPASLFHTFN